MISGSKLLGHNIIHATRPAAHHSAAVSRFLHRRTWVLTDFLQAWLLVVNCIIACQER